MNAHDWFTLAFLILVLAAFITTVLARCARLAGYVNLAAVAAAGAIMLYFAGRALAGETLAFVYPALQLQGFPAVPAFRMDPLSALFTGLISVLAVASALFTTGYLPFYHQENPQRYYFPFPLFIAGMLAVVTVADLFYFIVFWEFMTLASYFLVVYKNDSAETLTAGYLYFFMTHISSAGLILATIVLSGYTGSFSLSVLPVIFRDLAVQQPGLLHLILAMFFVGFGTKAGMFPFSNWLPETYPVAPASITALLSGVMSKMGVYGLLRIFWLVPVSSMTTFWGTVIALFGTLSMVVGNLRALGEDDSKRLLAQSSIGQMGYILLGMGSGLLFMESYPLLSTLGFVGALYHVVNHACFKSLLFFNTGSLLFRTGTRDLNRLGGLIAIMPLTAACGLVGALSIAGMPPFNGFMSKWLIYQAAIFGGLQVPLLALAGVIAIFISTVSLAAYIKYLGTAYLGILPERFAHSDKGVPVAMASVEIVLAAGCIALGLFPALPVAVLYGVVRSSLATALPPLSGVMDSLAWGGVVYIDGNMVSGASPLIILTALLLCVLIGYGIHRVNDVKVYPVAVWNCGEVLRADEMRYRPAGFYLTFKACLAFVYRNYQWPQWRLPPFLANLFDLDRWIYFPIGNGFVKLCQGVSRLHSGVAQMYLFWQVIGFGLVAGALFWIIGG